jgi:hypothetical protein
MGRYWSNGYLWLIMERISSLFSPTIVAASIQKAFQYPVVGEAIYTGVGLNTWTCPAGVYSVSVVCVAGGGGGFYNAQNSATGGGGGALAYKNTISVVPGVTYNLQVGEGGYTSTTGIRMLATNSWFGNTSTVFAERGQYGRTATGATTVQSITQGGFGGQIYIGDGGGPGGNCGLPTVTGALNNGLGGGGAGGYSGSGGSGGSSNSTVALNGTSGSGGGGGGGAGALSISGGAGGGVGLYGEGTSGAGGQAGVASNSPLRAGQPGSNGSPLVANTVGTTIYNIGGDYGGGGGAGYIYASRGANGAIRIVWPGDFRTFPSQNLETHTVTQNYQYANLQMGYAVSLKPVSISGNIGPVTYTISPSIPANTNITFNANTGILSGNAALGYPETSHIISTVDSVGQSSSNTLIISIGAPSDQVVFSGDPGGIAFNTLQTTWTVPANVYSISMIAVGCGGSTLIEANGYSSLSGAGGGATAFVNNYKVTPGQVLDIYIDKPKIGYNVVSNGTTVSYNGSTICKANSGGNSTAYYTGRGFAGTFVTGQYGYNGGNGGNVGSGFYKGGGGGAAGYSGDGGAGAQALLSGSGGATGSGAAGGGAPSNDATATGKGGGGGGIGLQGQGATGGGTSYVAGTAVGAHGRNGSYRGDIVQLVSTNLGGDYGGGAGGGNYNTLNAGGYGGPGAIRIMWPGTLRRYDANTRTEDTQPVGQVEFTTYGAYTWTCPEGVYSVSAVCIGAGGTAAASQFGIVQAYAGGGGGLGYKNNIPVVPGQTYTIQVGRRGEWVANNYALLSTDSYFIANTIVAGLAPKPSAWNAGGYVGDGGGNGGTGGTASQGATGGGGAGGYSGNGGNGGSPSSSAGGNGSGGGGGGGANYGSLSGVNYVGGKGGGTGIYGQGTSGTGGSGFVRLSTTYYANNGTAGSGGSNQLYGGGGGVYASYGGDGAVRLIWPGDQRQFPSTRTANE